MYSMIISHHQYILHHNNRNTPRHSNPHTYYHKAYQLPYHILNILYPLTPPVEQVITNHTDHHNKHSDHYWIFVFHYSVNPSIIPDALSDKKPSASK